jgi:hypothetical protein
MILDFTLTGQDLVELIKTRIMQEVSKHGDPGSFEVEIHATHAMLEASPLEENVIVLTATLEKTTLRDYTVRAVAHPKATKQDSQDGLFPQIRANKAQEFPERWVAQRSG